MEDEEFSIATIANGSQFVPANEQSMINRLQQNNSGYSIGAPDTPFYDPLGIFSSASATPVPSFQPKRPPFAVSNPGAPACTNDSYFERMKCQLQSAETDGEDDETMSNHSLSSIDENAGPSTNTDGRNREFRNSFRSEQISQISHHSLSDEDEVSDEQPKAIISAPTGNAELKIIEDLRTELASIRDLNQHLIASQQETSALLKAKAEELLEAESDRQRLQTDLDSYRSRLVNSERELGDTRSELQTVQEKLERAESDLQETRDSLGTKNSTLEQKITSLTAQINGLSKSQTHISVIRAALEQEKELEVLAVKKEMLAEKEKILMTMQAELEMDKQENEKKLQRQLEKVREEADRKVAGKDAELDRLQKSFAEEKAKHSRNMSQLQEVSKMQFLEQQNRIDSLSAELSRSRAELKRQTELTENQRKVIELHGKETNERKSVVDAGSQNVTEYPIANLQSKLDQSLAIQRQLNDEKDQLKAKLAEAEQTGNALKSRIKELETLRRSCPKKQLPMPAIAEQENDSAAEREIAELRDRNEELIKSCESLSALISRNEANLQQYQKRIRELELKLDSFGRENNSLRRSLIKTSSTPNLMTPVNNQPPRQSSSHLFKTIDDGRIVEKLDAALRKKQTEIDCMASTITTLQNSHEQELKALKSKYSKLYEESVAQIKSKYEAERSELLRRELDRFNQKHSEEMQKLEQQLNDQHHQSMQSMKAKYLETLRSMRDDVASSKQKSVEKMRHEWEKRKENLESQWKDRMELMRREYEEILRNTKSRSSTMATKRPVFGGSMNENRANPFDFTAK